MTRGTLAVLLGLTALAFTPAPARAQGREGTTAVNGETITLAIGEAKTISAREVRNYSEGVQGVVDVKLTTDASQFVINGRHQGSTTLLLIKNDGAQITINIDVFVRSPDVVEHELAQLLDGLPSVRVRRVGAHIVMDGAVADDEELQRVRHIATLYPGEVDSLVSIGAPSPVVSTGETQEPQRFVVRIDFYFVQYDITSSYAVGIGWPASLGGATITSTLTYDFLDGIAHTATATLSNQPLPRLDIASTRGWAKVLKQATVITNNGVEAEFSNGGEQNFSVTTGLGVGIQRIQFGTEVTVLPKYVPQTHQIDIKLSADVSDLTAPGSGTTIPGRNTSKLTTNVSLKLGQSLVLSGIRRESTTHTVTGIPLLKDIPILGILFGSHADDTEQTEGAVFIVPSVLGVAQNYEKELVSSALATFKDFHGDVDKVKTFNREPGTSPSSR
jgi:pilus assembly protein CpaC